MAKQTRILGISGSLRKASLNSALVRSSLKVLPEGASLEIADITQIPFFNADIQGRPAAVEQLFTQLQNANALLLACPEYNYSMAPALKNALDWASRFPDNQLLAGKAVGICSVGGGMGGAKAQYHLRQTCVYLDLHPVNKPEVTVRGATPDLVDATGEIQDAKTLGQMKTLLESLCNLSVRLRAGS